MDGHSTRTVDPDLGLASRKEESTYSFPAVVAGIEMDSDLLISVSQHKNVVGTKFTCRDTGKLARVADTMKAKTPIAENSGYICYGGLADFTLMSLIAGGSGTIAGGANIVPKACVRIVELFRQGAFQEAMNAQRLLSSGDGFHTKAGIAGTKIVLQYYHGYGGLPRQPLLGMGKSEADALIKRMEEIVTWEKTL